MRSLVQTKVEHGNLGRVGICNTSLIRDGLRIACGRNLGNAHHRDQLGNDAEILFVQYSQVQSSIIVNGSRWEHDLGYYFTGRAGGKGKVRGEGKGSFVAQEVGRKQALQAFPRLGEVYGCGWK